MQLEANPLNAPLARHVALPGARHLRSRLSERSTVLSDVARQTASDKTAVDPFHVSIPEAELSEMHKRITATGQPDPETVTDESQGCIELRSVHDDNPLGHVLTIGRWSNGSRWPALLH